MSKKIEYRIVKDFGYYKPEDEDEKKQIEENLEEIEAPKKIEGYAAVYNSLSEDLGGFREVIDQGAFKRSIEDPEHDIRALVDHDAAKIIGRQSANTLEVREDAKGVYVMVDPPNTTVGKDIVESISRGDVSGMSVGFRVVGEYYDDEGIRHITDADLFECSCVTFPAYQATEVSYRKLTIAPDSANHDSGDEDPNCRNKLLLKKIEILEKSND